jgi:sugar phosphate isomerase/epimerase
MLIQGHHLSYCTNIHPGETWEDIFQSLKDYIPKVKDKLGVKGPFGIGLRLSNQASETLISPDKLKEFKDWLAVQNCYVFTMNGFPYGDFHHAIVKDKVHVPDWSTTARKDYTIRLFHILEALTPTGHEGSISTSPISYRHWFELESERDKVLQTACEHLAEVTAELHQIEQKTQKTLHLDIEPEPDGFLENTEEVLWFFRDWLLPKGGAWLVEKLGISSGAAAQLLKHHIRICYDVCHFAIVYEKAQDTFRKFQEEGIKIGKIQISAALKVDIPKDKNERQILQSNLQPLAESTYLHQVIGRYDSGNLQSYPDLPEAIAILEETEMEEMRIHFHVPVFLAHYGDFSSTQADIISVLQEIKKNPVCSHLEVETYTWDVLDKDLRQELSTSISREMDWVIKTLEK